MAPRRPARTTKKAPATSTVDTIVDVDVDGEMRESFLEYAYSVIYSRALPDARDGLKPVQRRILFQMDQMGLRPDRGHVKSARVVGEVMGRLHPHGDSAIYDALVRMAQPFSLRLPFVDGHGNFGSIDDGPAAMRYTECRLAQPALAMVRDIGEDVVDFVPNYDNRETEPVVLPAAIPALFVNGAAGIAVGMATSIPSHNLGEVVAAARHLVLNPLAPAEELLRFVPGPDLPSGGTIIGLDGLREAYVTGRGAYRVRGTARIEQISARRKGIVITELPPGVGPERMIERIKDLVDAKKLTGIHDVVDLTDGDSGLQLIVEVKNTVNAEALLHELYRKTPLEDSASINCVALVDGQPRTLGLAEALQVFVDHRLVVIRRRSQYRRSRAEERLHLVEGLLVAIVDIDEVIALIRSSDDTAAARDRLITVFDLTAEQTQYILEMPLRRLTKFSLIELNTERDELVQRITDLTSLLDDEQQRRQAVADEMQQVSDDFHTPRRTILLESDGAQATKAPSLEVDDDPCLVLMSTSGLIARTTVQEWTPAADRSSHDLIQVAIPATVRGHIAVVTSTGKAMRINVVDLPHLPESMSAPPLSGGAPLTALITLGSGESVVSIAPIFSATPLMLATAHGMTKRVLVDPESKRDDWELISLKDGDAVIGAAACPEGDQIVLITSDAKTLKFPAASVRVQGRSAGGMAGISLADGAEVIYATSIASQDSLIIATVAGSTGQLPGTSAHSIKVSAMNEVPSKGRATGGVRVHRFLKGEDVLTLGWVGMPPVRAASSSGAPVSLTSADTTPVRRDASGAPLRATIAAFADIPQSRWAPSEPMGDIES